MAAFLQSILEFLLQLLALTVHFFIDILNLILQFANAIVGGVR